MQRDVILLIGARGQIGTVLLPKLQEVYGIDSVVASDILAMEGEGIFEQFDATHAPSLVEVVKKYKVTQIYHLAAMLSAKGEQNPFRTWDINMQSFLNVLEIGHTYGVEKIFMPSSIAVFGATAPKENTPQHSYLDPTTVYGISKVAAENWGNYYFKRYGLDIRSIRYPGIISHQSLAGGGTTDYAVDIYHKAILDEPFTCYLHKNTRLPMIYIDDAVRATLEIMEAPADHIKVRSAYNLAGFSFTPAELYQTILHHYPDFQIAYCPDFRQKIADSWPSSIDDSFAAADWKWKPQFDLDKMTQDMISNLSLYYERKKETTTH